MAPAMGSGDGVRTCCDDLPWRPGGVRGNVVFQRRTNVQITASGAFQRQQGKRVCLLWTAVFALWGQIAV